MQEPQKRQFDPSFLLSAEDLQTIMLSLLKGGLNKQARDSVGSAIASHVNRAVAPALQGSKVVVDLALSEAVEKLRSSGYAIIDDVFDAAEIDSIHEHIVGKPVLYGQEGGYNTVGGRAEGLVEDRPEGTRFAEFHTKDLLTCPAIYRVVHDLQLIGAATAYLGAPATISTVTLWWSYPVPLPATGMQMYHHDRGDFRSTNLFVYLTDVSPTTGPHSFVEKTHEMAVLHPLSVALFGSDKARFQKFWTWMEQHRKTDEEVHNFFPQDLIKSFVGPRGMSFLEDTRGQHKGTQPTTGTRLAFEIVYSTLPKYNEIFTPLSRSKIEMPPGLETDTAKIHPLVRYATRLMLT